MQLFLGHGFLDSLSLGSAGLIETIRTKELADLRALKIFASGYSVAMDGKPLSPDDETNQIRAQHFYEAFASSGDKELIAPQLSEITKEIIEMNIDIDFMDDDYVIRNFSKLYEQSSKICYFENVFKANQWYYKTLPYHEYMVLASRFDCEKVFLSAFSTKTQVLGIDVNQKIKMPTGKTKEMFQEESAEMLKGLQTRLSSKADVSYGPSKFEDSSALRSIDDKLLTATVYMRLKNEKLNY